jgi:hypothetical protein
LAQRAGLSIQFGVAPQLEQMKVQLQMHRWSKRNFKQFQDSIRAMFQAVVSIDGTFLGDDMVFMDGEATEEQRDWARERLPFKSTLKDTELYMLSKEIEETTTADQLYFKPQVITGVKPFCRTRTWGSSVFTKPWPVPICPRTCRPYYMIRPGVSWEQGLDEQTGHMDRDTVISINRLLELYVNKYEAYPRSLESFIRFMYMREGTLPSNIVMMTRSVLEDYQAIMQTMEVKEFIQTLKQSCSIPDRLRMENETTAGSGVSN